MLVASLKILFGFILLTWSANHLVNGASALARNIGVSPLLIGLTIVAIGTAAPEILVSIIASYSGSPGIAIGNAIGSNVTNIGLVIGICALIRPLVIEEVTFQLELPILAITSILVCLLLWGLGLNLVSAIILLFGGLIYVTWLIIRGLKQRKADPLLADEFSETIPSDMSTTKATLWLVIGLILLPISAKILVDGAEFIARGLGISEVVIGLTIIAIGTSLPELAASLISTLKKEDGIAVGNVIGSNIFNLTLNENIELKKLAEYLYNEQNIWLGRANEKGIVKFTINESLLTRDLPSIINAWKKGIERAQI